MRNPRTPVPDGSAQWTEGARLVSVGRTSVHIYSWMSDDANQMKERVREVSLMLIETIEPLDVTMAQERS